MIKFDKLFKIFEERGISQYKLYTYLGLNRSQISRLKTGDVTVHTLNQVLNILGDCTLDDIAEFIPDSKEENEEHEKKED